MKAFFITRQSCLVGWHTSHPSPVYRTPWTVTTVMPMKTNMQIRQICLARNLTPKPGPLFGTCVSERTQQNTSITWTQTPPSMTPRPDPCVKTLSRIQTRTPQSESCVHITVAAKVCDCVNHAKLTAHYSKYMYVIDKFTVYKLMAQHDVLVLQVEVWW